MTNPDDVLVVQKALEQSKTKDEFRRILCVWLRLSLGMSAKDIAIGIGQTPAAVRKIQSLFGQQGVQMFLTKKRGGRKRENISLAREKQILNQFHRRAQRGATLSVREIQKAYELSAGKPVAPSTIYRLIARHGLRRYLPRARGSKES